MTIAFDRFGSTALLALALAGAAQAQEPAKHKMTAMMEGHAEYTVVLKGRWTAANFALEYPAGAHFSGLIGASHDGSFKLFAEGAMPTPGLERLSEMGRHSPLDDEIRKAIAAGTAGALVTSGPLKDFGDSIVTTVMVDEKHPMVSLVAMIAPSPDWFAGVANVNLRGPGGWVAHRTVELNAYDSGGDDGTTYTAPDKDTSPKRPTMRNASKHFESMGMTMPVATITFTRK